MHRIGWQSHSGVPVLVTLSVHRCVRTAGVRARNERGNGMTALRASLATRGLAGLLSLLVGGGVIGLAAAPAWADSAPADPASTPTTVTADALPTVQINGVAWAQVVVG